jgi:hypothetical protein
MAEQPERSFFWTLAQRAGTQQRENQLSSTFAACFTQSSWFRRVIIDAVGGLIFAFASLAMHLPWCITLGDEIANLLGDSQIMHESTRMHQHGGKSGVCKLLSQWDIELI